MGESPGPAKVITIVASESITSSNRAPDEAPPFSPSVTVWGRLSAFVNVTSPIATVISAGPKERLRIVTTVTSAPGVSVGAGDGGSVASVGVLTAGAGGAVGGEG